MPNIIALLKVERDKIAPQLNGLNAALAAFAGAYEVADGAGPPRRRKLSAKGLANIRAAQKARWAKQKGASTGVFQRAPKRRISAAGRARIAAAARARGRRSRLRRNDEADWTSASGKVFRLGIGQPRNKVFLRAAQLWFRNDPPRKATNESTEAVCPRVIEHRRPHASIKRFLYLKG
jgi:hypothetical protein